MKTQLRRIEVASGLAALVLGVAGAVGLVGDSYADGGSSEIIHSSQERYFRSKGNQVYADLAAFNADMVRSIEKADDAELQTKRNAQAEAERQRMINLLEQQKSERGQYGYSDSQDFRILEVFSCREQTEELNDALSTRIFKKRGIAFSTNDMVYRVIQARNDKNRPVELTYHQLKLYKDSEGNTRVREMRNLTTEIPPGNTAIRSWASQFASPGTYGFTFDIDGIPLGKNYFFTVR